MTLPIDAREFHVYAAEWTPHGVAFLVDGEPVKIVDQAPAYPMQLMLSFYELPPRGDEPTPYPKEFVVDYVGGYRLTTASSGRSGKSAHPSRGCKRVACRRPRSPRYLRVSGLPAS